jgi:hypothetical protein
MELIVTILTAFPIGYLVRNRAAGYLAFIAVHGYVFTFQTLNQITEWTGGTTASFGPYPKAKASEVWAYGLVNLLIFGAGLVLVFLGQRLAARRRQRGTALNLDSTRT